MSCFVTCIAFYRAWILVRRLRRVSVLLISSVISSVIAASSVISSVVVSSVAISLIVVSSVVISLVVVSLVVVSLVVVSSPVIVRVVFIVTFLIFPRWTCFFPICVLAFGLVIVSHLLSRLVYRRPMASFVLRWIQTL